MRTGKHPVICGNRTGFIVNFLLFPYLNDAVGMIEAQYAPADRLRRFFSWFGLITTTVSPAPSSASTTGPSGRSIVTSATPIRASRRTSPRRPSSLCTTVQR